MGKPQLTKVNSFNIYKKIDCYRDFDIQLLLRDLFSQYIIHHFTFGKFIN